MAARKTAKKKATRRKQAEPDSRGLKPDEMADGSPPQAVAELEALVRKVGGTVLSPYRDPVGGRWHPYDPCRWDTRHLAAVSLPPRRTDRQRRDPVARRLHRDP